MIGTNHEILPYKYHYMLLKSSNTAPYTLTEVSFEVQFQGGDTKLFSK